MTLFDFLRRRNPDPQTIHDPPGGQTPRLTPNQQSTLDAILRYEAKVLPRLRDAKRPAGRPPGAAEEERLAALKAHLLEARRDAHRVRARFVVTLPQAVVKKIQQQKATGVELKALDPERLSLTLSRPDPRNAGQRVTLGKYEIIPVREKRGAGRPVGSEAPVRIETRDAKLSLVLAPPAVPTRLRAQTGTNQGETQYRLHQIRKSAKRRLKRPEQEKAVARGPKPGDRKKRER